MPKSPIITLSEENEYQIALIRLTTGATIPYPSVLPHAHVTKDQREALQDLGWTRVCDLWYSPSQQRSGLVAKALKQKAERDVAAREKGARLAKAREESALREAIAAAHLEAAPLEAPKASPGATESPPSLGSPTHAFTWEATDWDTSEALEERATGRVLYALLQQDIFDDWLLVDALLFTEYAIKCAIRQWQKNRCTVAEIAEDMETYIDFNFDNGTREAAELAYRTTITLMRELFEDSPEEEELSPIEDWDITDW
jgi:hypothetical protein